MLAKYRECMHYKYNVHENSHNCVIYIYISVFEFASIDLTLDRFTLTKGTGVTENNVFLLVLIKVD